MQGWVHQRSLWPSGVLSSVLERVRNHGEPDARRGEVEVWAVQPHYLGANGLVGFQRCKHTAHPSVKTTQEIRCIYADPCSQLE